MKSCPFLSLPLNCCQSILLVTHNNLPSLTWRTRLSLFQKINILNKICLGTSFGALVSKHVVGRWTIACIQKIMDSLIKSTNNEERALKQKAARPVCYTEIEKRVVQSFTLPRQAHLSVTTNFIIAKTLDVKRQLLKYQYTTGTHKALRKFSGLNDWASRPVASWAAVRDTVQGSIQRQQELCFGKGFAFAYEIIRLQYKSHL